MDKVWYKSMTFWGAACIFLAGGLEALGIGTGILEAVKQILTILGIPLVAFGLRRALK